jgi:methylisocitrate lyase
MTEFGMSPLMTVEHLSEVGVELVLYPLTAFRVMSQAAGAAYQTIRKTGTQSSILDQMQTRKELYEVLDYHAYEQKIDDLLKKADSE